jgi:hypothetical protein
LDSNAQVDPRDNFLIAENEDSLMPDALLSRGMASGKGICNLPSEQRDHREVENELSSAAFSSQSFGVPDMSFKPGCSGDIAVNDGGIPSQGLWNNQTQRMRTFTKVGTVYFENFFVTNIYTCTISKCKIPLLRNIYFVHPWHTTIHLTCLFINLKFT